MSSVPSFPRHFSVTGDGDAVTVSHTIQREKDRTHAPRSHLAALTSPPLSPPLGTRARVHWARHTGALLPPGKLEPEHRGLLESMEECEVVKCKPFVCGYNGRVLMKMAENKLCKMNKKEKNRNLEKFVLLKSALNVNHCQVTWGGNKSVSGDANDEFEKSDGVSQEKRSTPEKSITMTRKRHYKDITVPGVKHISPGVQDQSKKPRPLDQSCSGENDNRKSELLEKRTARKKHHDKDEMLKRFESQSYTPRPWERRTSNRGIHPWQTIPLSSSDENPWSHDDAFAGADNSKFAAADDGMAAILAAAAASEAANEGKQRKSSSSKKSASSFGFGLKSFLDAVNNSML